MQLLLSKASVTLHSRGATRRACSSRGGIAGDISEGSFHPSLAAIVLCGEVFLSVFSGVFPSLSNMTGKNSDKGGSVKIFACGNCKQKFPQARSDQGALCDSCQKSVPVPPQHVQEPPQWVHSLSTAISGLAQKIDAVGDRELGSGASLEAEPAWVHGFSRTVEGIASVS